MAPFGNVRRECNHQNDFNNMYRNNHKVRPSMLRLEAHTNRSHSMTVVRTIHKHYMWTISTETFTQPLVLSFQHVGDNTDVRVHYSQRFGHSFVRRVLYLGRLTLSALLRMIVANIFHVRAERSSHFSAVIKISYTRCCRGPRVHAFMRT